MFIEYSPLFKRELGNLYACGSQYYSPHILSKLIPSIRLAKQQLMASPQLGAREPLLAHLNFEYRRYVLNSTFKLIYTIDGDKIIFVDIWDARRSPEVLSSRIN